MSVNGPSVRAAAGTAIVLDTGPLGLVTGPVGSRDSDRSREWLLALDEIGCRFYVPQIADYELRRELLRAGKAQSVALLDRFNVAEGDRYLPLTAADIHRAAQFWADLRNRNKGGAANDALDGDLLIAAQAESLRHSDAGRAVIVATKNARHLAPVTRAALWSDIGP